MVDIGNQAADFFTDVRAIEKAYGISDTYSYEGSFPEFEIYSVLIKETVE